MTRKIVSLLLALMMTMMCASYAVAESPNQYHLTDEPVTYTYLMSNNFTTDFNEDVYFQKLEEMTGVHIDWTVVSTDNFATRKSLMFASGDLYDIMGGISSNEIIQYSPLGIFFPLDTLMYDNMPNFMEVCAIPENEMLISAMSLTDGHMYSLPGISQTYMSASTCAIINTEWLEKLNLEMPTTTDELFDVLVAFKEQDPNGNGQADEIPFGFDYAMNWTHGAINSWWGVGIDFMIRDGVVTYSPYEEGWKEMVKWLNKCWEAGLIDPELFTQDSSTFNAKVKMDEEPIYGMMQCYHKKNILTDVGMKRYQVFGPINGGTEVWGALKTRLPGFEWQMNRATISADVENPELLLRWLDIGYDDYYGAQMLEGAVGECLELDDNGQFYLKDVPAEYDSSINWKNAVHPSNQFAFAVTGKYSNDLRLAGEVQQVIKEVHDLYSPYYINDVMVSTYQLPEENEAIQKYETDIASYTKEMYALWVTGERDVEADWEEYRAKLEALHVQDYVAAQQAFYDRIYKK